MWLNKKKSCKKIISGPTQTHANGSSTNNASAKHFSLKPWVGPECASA